MPPTPPPLLPPPSAPPTPPPAATAALPARRAGRCTDVAAAAAVDAAAVAAPTDAAAAGHAAARGAAVAAAALRSPAVPLRHANVAAAAAAVAAPVAGGAAGDLHLGEDLSYYVDLTFEGDIEDCHVVELLVIHGISETVSCSAWDGPIGCLAAVTGQVQGLTWEDDATGVQDALVQDSGQLPLLVGEGGSEASAAALEREWGTEAAARASVAKSIENDRIVGFEDRYATPQLVSVALWNWDLAPPSWMHPAPPPPPQGVHGAMLEALIVGPVGGILACVGMAWLVVCCAMKRKEAAVARVAGAFDEDGADADVKQAARRRQEGVEEVRGRGRLVSTGSQMASQI